MSLPRSLYAASLSAWWCCPECDTVKAICPGCAEPLPIKRPANHPPALPLHWAFKCPDPYCGAALALTVCGYRPNPTGDAPAHRSPLSDPLPVAERPRPNLRPRVPSPPRPKRPAPPPKPAPCPAGEPRYRLAAWDEWGWLPPGVAPSAIAAAYRRRFGVEPRRDATYRTFRAYSLRELGLALGELGLAPAAEPRQGVGQ